MTRRIGLLGGSFNPAHSGHRAISLAAIEALGLDEVWWLVSPGNPLKDGAGDMAPFDVRFRSARAMACHAPIKVSAIERRMGMKEGEFRRSYDRGFGRLKISLRRQQIEAAKAGNTAMLIWLGKQLLEQADKREVKEEATVTQKTATLELTPEDEEFLRRKAVARSNLSGSLTFEQGG